MSEVEISPAEASLELHRQILDKFGDDPEILADLDWQVERVPIGSTGRFATVTIVRRPGEEFTRERLAVAGSGLFSAIAGQG